MYVASEFPGKGGVLTPAHFLALRSNLGLAFSFDHEDPDYGPSQESLSRLWKSGQDILKQFWACWSQDYLTSLRQSAMRQPHGGVACSPTVGELVLVKEENLPRGRWMMGRVEEVHQSADTAIRSCTVRLPSGKLVRRPVSLLFPLELTGAAPIKSCIPDQKCQPSSPVRTEANKPVRAAAQKCRNTINELIDDGRL